MVTFSARRGRANAVKNFEEQVGQRGPIYHIAERERWLQSKPSGNYCAPSLETQGFIHFSALSQVVRVANRWFLAQQGLVLLELPQSLEQPVRWEDTYGAGEVFPHLYGPLPVASVSRSFELRPQRDGTFVLPQALWKSPSVHHVALRSNDVSSLSAFYQAVFGLPLVREQPHSHWLALGTRAVLMIEARGTSEPVPSQGDQQLFCLASNDLEAEEARLVRLGISVEHRTHSTLYFRDPEGRRVAWSSHPLL